MLIKLSFDMIQVDIDEYMAQAHETGTSQVGGPKLAKVFYGRID